MGNSSAHPIRDFAPRAATNTYRFWTRLARSMRALYNAPVEHMLHPTRSRMLAYGWGISLGHPFFYYMWHYVYPENWESMWLRALAALTGLPFALGWLGDPRDSDRLKSVFTITTWYQFPFVFTFLYLCNPGSHVWLGTAGSTIVIYCMLVDWRVAILGGISGSIAAFVLYRLLLPILGVSEVMTFEQFVLDLPMLGFAASIGLILSMSSANLRLENLNASMTTIGIMAHELRTPIGTATLIGIQLSILAKDLSANPETQEAASEVQFLGEELKSILAQMTHQIDTQILNTRQLQLSAPKETLSASEVVMNAVSKFPWQSERHSLAVEVYIKNNFDFVGHSDLMRQMLHNLISNSVKSLIAAGSGWKFGSIQIIVDVQDQKGRIEVADAGGGLTQQKIKTLFQPFTSSSPNSAHGLGLSFCARAVKRHRGVIEAFSPNEKGGATFIIQLPCTSSSSSDTEHTSRSEAHVSSNV